MSSPIARTNLPKSSRKLIAMHQNLSHDHRVALLARLLAQTIGDGATGAKGLDIGCGDMKIAEAISSQNPALHFECLDIYPLPDALKDEPRWEKYRQIDGSSLPYQDQSLDFALFCDVLHHMPGGVPDRMLFEAGRVARRVVVKDHFEYGLWSRTWLRLMDFAGNWAYGVSVPKKYYSQTAFAEAVQRAGLRIESLTIGVDLYSHLPVVRRLLSPRWQFIAVLAR